MKDKFVPPKIKHILRDGTVLDSMDDFVLPVNDETIPVYKIWAERVKRHMKEKTA